MEKQPKLLDQLRYMLRLKHRRFSTEKAYVNWVKRFILYHNKTHPRKMGAKDRARNKFPNLGFKWMVDLAGSD